MALTLSNGTQNITGSVTSTAEEVTVTTVEGSADNTDLTLGTVGAGKKWYILNATLSFFNSNSTSNIAKLKANAQTILQVRSNVVDQNNNIAQKWTYKQCPVITAGQTLVLANSNGANYPCYVTVQYAEVTA